MKKITLSLLALPLLLSASEIQQPEVMAEPSPSPSFSSIGLSNEALKENISLLKTILADEYVLYTKTYNYHWNVTGNNFSELHALFKQQYEQLETFVDSTAERIRALKGIAPGTLAEFSSLTNLKEEPGVVPEATAMLKNLLNDHETIIRTLRNAITITAKNNDMGTNNFLTDLLMKHEKTAWMLRAYQQD